MNQLFLSFIKHMHVCERILFVHFIAVN